MEFEVIALVVLSSIALFAAVGGWIAHLKNRQPLEGLILGALLGPVGVWLVARKPFAHRPMIDQGAWNSFRSLVSYQADPNLLRLPAPTTRSTAQR